MKDKLKEEIQMERKWAMPNKQTFIIKPIKELLEEEVCSFNKSNPLKRPIKDLADSWYFWADPFAGYNSPVRYTNDLNPEIETMHHLDALDFLGGLKDNSMDGVLYDPPYSITQARKYGCKKFASMRYWADCKNEMTRIIKPGGKAICFGWSSMGLGKNRGFKMTRILLVAHGASRNDTIVTVEIKK